MFKPDEASNEGFMKMVNILDKHRSSLSNSLSKVAKLVLFYLHTSYRYKERSEKHKENKEDRFYFDLYFRTYMKM